MDLSSTPNLAFHCVSDPKTKLWRFRLLDFDTGSTISCSEFCFIDKDKAQRAARIAITKFYQGIQSNVRS